MEVGIEDCLHIEFEYSKSKWDTVSWISCSWVIFYFSQNFINTGFSESTLACYNCTSLVCYIAHAVTSLMQFHHVSLVTSNCAHQIEVTICSHLDWMCHLHRYHLKDVIVGKIYFLLVRIKIKHMELEVRRRESTGSGPNTYNESETLAKYEIMDGAPVRGISIDLWNLGLDID
jgi:hypothetical protein